MKDKIVIFSIASFIILFLGFVAHRQYFRTKRNVITLYSEKQTILAHQAALTLESFIKERIKAIGVLAENPVVRQRTEKLLIIELKSTYEKVRGFEFITILNEEAKAIVGYPDNYSCPSNEIAEIRVRFRKIFDQARDHHKPLFFSKNILTDGKVFLCLIVPIFS